MRTAGIARVVLVTVVLAIGCAPKKSFDITVHNRTDVPVLLWLTKDGPPAEKGWLTTEQFLAAPASEPSPGVRLPPHKSADTGKVRGTFPKGTNAILLVYRTGRAADQPGGSKPLAVRLRPGRNEFNVGINDTGRLYLYDPVTSVPYPIATEP